MKTEFEINENEALNKTEVSKSVLHDIFEQLDHYKDFLVFRCDIIANDTKRWLGSSKNQLPSFEYYLKNCVEYKGGKYDFTVKRYSTPAQTLEPITFHSQNKHQMSSKRLYRTIIHSFWMGTPFNYETVVQTVC
jgi:hypothetical protein